MAEFVVINVGLYSKHFETTSQQQCFNSAEKRLHQAFHAPCDTLSQVVDYCEGSYLKPGANKREVSQTPKCRYENAVRSCCV